MKQQNLIESFNSAIEGFVYVFKTQRNMRLHFLIGLVALVLGVFLNFTYMEIAILCLTIAFVLFAEMFNTAIEHTIDLVKEEFHPLARIVKDICAGAVLLSAMAAVIIGYILFINRAGIRIEENIIKIKESHWHVTFIILLVILAIVVLGKVLLRSGTPLRGGMPSGHSAVAFSIWAIISFLYPKSIVIFLVFVLAFMVARSRVRDRVHSTLEVISGALLGLAVTIFIFQVLRR
ncbi:MAG: diacylglycerol kinase [Candidatus Omnitrophica bacterium]|nr:diacylglycerol kinase [Candidatus Omnitrophota bacterium]MBU1933001.1 diacylglycerol kinase [Candidatus Omnitrophota bacterium]